MAQFIKGRTSSGRDRWVNLDRITHVEHFHADRFVLSYEHCGMEDTIFVTRDVFAKVLKTEG